MTAIQDIDLEDETTPFTEVPALIVPISAIEVQ